MLRLGQIYILKPEHVSYKYPLSGVIVKINDEVVPNIFCLTSLDYYSKDSWVSEEELNTCFEYSHDAKKVEVLQVDHSYYKINSHNLERI